MVLLFLYIYTYIIALPSTSAVTSVTWPSCPWFGNLWHVSVWNMSFTKKTGSKALDALQNLPRITLANLRPEPGAKKAVRSINQFACHVRYYGQMLICHFCCDDTCQKSLAPILLNAGKTPWQGTAWWQQKRPRTQRRAAERNSASAWFWGWSDSFLSDHSKIWLQWRA